MQYVQQHKESFLFSFICLIVNHKLNSLSVVFIHQPTPPINDAKDLNNPHPFPHRIDRCSRSILQARKMPIIPRFLQNMLQLQY